MRRLFGAALVVAACCATPAASQPVSRAYTQFDSDKCRHTKGKAAEDYGFWRCAGHDGIEVYLRAGDQRMTVSFGRNAAREPAASQTFPRFNSAYKGTVEWRLEALPNGRPRAFATILRWNVTLDDDERDTTGRVLVVTRLGAGEVCHVGYVDARANPDANALAQQLADERARGFKCGTDKPVVLGKVTPGLYLPKAD
jgi:hypothetical protein